MANLKDLAWCLFGWGFTPATKDELAGCGFTVGQACSQLKDGSPGPGNEVLMRLAQNIETQYGIRTVLQRELALVDPEWTYHIIDSGLDGQSTKESNSWVIGERQARFCMDKGVRRVVALTNPVHMPRLLRVLRKEGLEPVAALVRRDIRLYTYPNAAQWFYRRSDDDSYGRVRRIWHVFLARFNMYGREFLARIYSLYLGRI